MTYLRLKDLESVPILRWIWFMELQLHLLHFSKVCNSEDCLMILPSSLNMDSRKLDILHLALIKSVEETGEFLGNWVLELHQPEA
jgi:hypothetical protein